ncbi:MAG: hypothetical protein ACKPBV_05385 [Sphaerospermopsis kisseleviana]
MPEDQSGQAGEPSGKMPGEDSERESSSSESNEIQSSQSEGDQVDEIPAELLNALPPEIRQVVSSFTAMVHSPPSRQSPLTKKLTSEHITKIIVNSDNDSRRDYNLKRLSLGSVLALVAMILIYAATTKDKDLSEKILVASIAAVGGAGVGYGVGKSSSD